MWLMMMELSSRIRCLNTARPNVDTKLFGIALGEPLAIPECRGGLFGPPRRRQIASSNTSCWKGWRPPLWGPNQDN